MANLQPKKDSDSMRVEIQRKLIENADKFWKDWEELKPKDRCELYLKMMPYGFAKVPDERPIGEDERQRLILEETTRKATIIGAGLPQKEEEESIESFEEND